MEKNTMSDLVILIAVTFLTMMTASLYFYVEEKINGLGAQIVTGVAQGIPISTGVRRAMLYQMWLPYEAGAFAMTSFFALATAAIAEHAGDTDVRRLVYFATFLFACAAVGELGTTIGGLFQYRAVLSRAKRN
jgi:hypothetical protein